MYLPPDYGTVFIFSSFLCKLPNVPGLRGPGPDVGVMPSLLSRHTACWGRQEG